MPDAVVSLPDGLPAQIRWVAGELCAAAGLQVGEGGPALPLDPAWDLEGAAALLARKEEIGAPVDEHGRFLASASALAPARGAARRPRARSARGRGGGRRDARDRLSRAVRRFAVALTHDIDTPWRWSRRGVRGAASRLKHAVAARDGVAARTEATGLALAPLHRLRGSDPNWSHRRFAALERKHDYRSTCFVLAAHRDPHDGAAPEVYAARRARLVAELDRPGARGRAACELHLPRRRGACWRASAPSSRGCSAGRSPATGITTCACPGTTGSARSTALGFSYDCTLGHAERPGARAGLSFPFRPWDARAGRALRILELPLVLMDATLAEQRYLGLSPEAAWPEIERVLDHLQAVGGCASVLWHNDRFDRVYGRGWDRLYERMLDGIAARGGHAGTGEAARGALAGGAMRVLIVSFYFPPAGGGGVQRVLKLCRHLPELGIDVDVLAPDDPKWSAVDPGLAAEIPATTTVHRARYRGPSHAQTPAARLAAAHGVAGLGVRAALLGRRVLLPDPEVAWLPDALRAGTRIVRERGIDVVLSTSPPNSVHLIGAAIARRSGVPLVTDFRDSWLANPHRRYERRSVRAKRAVEARIARAALRGVAAVSAVTPSIAVEAAELAPAGTPVAGRRQRLRLRRVRRSRLRARRAHAHRPRRLVLRPAHAAAVPARPTQRSSAPARSCASACRRPSSASCGRPIASGRSGSGSGTRSHSRASSRTRARSPPCARPTRCCCSCRAPAAAGCPWSPGKVYEYLAAERPIVALVPPEGDAAALLRDTGSAWIADPDDEGAIGAALAEAVAAWEADRLGERRLTAEWRERLDRRTRAGELADLLRSVVSPGS